MHKFCPGIEKMDFQMFSWLIGYVNTKGKKHKQVLFILNVLTLGKNHGTILRNLYFFQKNQNENILGKIHFFSQNFLMIFSQCSATVSNYSEGSNRLIEQAL